MPTFLGCWEMGTRKMCCLIAAAATCLIFSAAQNPSPPVRMAQSCIASCDEALMARCEPHHRPRRQSSLRQYHASYEDLGVIRLYGMVLISRLGAVFPAHLGFACG